MLAVSLEEETVEWREGEEKEGEKGRREEAGTLGVLVVVPPQWPDLVLTSNIPSAEWRWG